MRAPSRRVRPASIALALALSAWACSGGDTTDLPGDTAAGAPSAAASPSASPFIEIPPEARRADLPPLDPDATPRTELGELRARYLPLWTQDFDLAFPPHVCGTAWELDAIAVPVPGVNVSHYGEWTTMAALGVMRYEHLLATASVQPTRLAQLCVAVAATDPARTDALSALAPLIATVEEATGELTTARLRDLLAADEDTHEPTDLTQPPTTPERMVSTEQGADGHATPTTQARPAPNGTGLNALPHEVTLVGVSPSSVLAVACIDPQHTASADQSSPDATSSAPETPPLLRAYELDVVRGIEDSVLDVSYRVSRIEDNDEGDCSRLPEWSEHWRADVRARADEGQIWLQVDETVSSDDLCDTATAPNTTDCPNAWTQQGATP